MKNKTYQYLNKTGYLLLVSICIISLILVGLLPTLWGNSIDNLINQDYQFAIKNFVIYFLVFITFKFVEYIRQYQFSKQKRIMEFNMKKVMIVNMLDLNYLQFNDINSGKFVSRFHSDVTEVSKFWLDTVINVFINFVFVAIVTIIIYRINRLISFFIIFNSLLITIANKYFKDIFQKQYSITRIIADNYFDKMYETLYGIVAIKVRGLKDSILNRNINIFNEVKVEETKLMKVKYFSEFIVSTIPIFNIVLSILIMVPKIKNGQHSIGTLMTILYLLPILEDKISLIITSALDYETFKISNERLTGLINPNIKNLEKFGSKSLASVDRIAFDNVLYEYPNSNVKVGPINFNAKLGDRIALIGESGSGKTTVLRLISRLLDPQSGQILINGPTNLDELTEDNLRKLIYMVTQNSEIFAGTIRENLSQNNRSISDQEIKEVLNKLGLFKFSENLEYQVTEKGENISGGEKQRLEIARAILSKSDVLILDEPYSSLDNDSAFTIYNILNDLSKSKIIMISSHKLKLIEDFDYIILFKNGNVMACGTHEKLCEESPYYNELLNKERNNNDL